MLRDNGQGLKNLIYMHDLITDNRKVPLEKGTQDYT